MDPLGDLVTELGGASTSMFGPSDSTSMAARSMLSSTAAPRPQTTSSRSISGPCCGGEPSAGITSSGCSPWASPSEGRKRRYADYLAGSLVSSP